jgi:hypothetical protein
LILIKTKMNNSLLIITLSGLLFFSMFNKKEIRENFWGLPQRRVRRMTEIVNPKTGHSTAIQNDGGYHRPQFAVTPGRTYAMTPHNAIHTPSFQSHVPLRTGPSLGVHANIKYGTRPDSRNMGFTSDPFGRNPMQASRGGITAPTPVVHSDQAFVGGPAHIRTPYIRENFRAGNTNAIAVHSNSTIPVDSMDAVNESGDVGQPIMYDRFVFSQARSRLRGQGDPIRGDLPIAPNTGGWFTPSAVPSNDLREGAINVIAGSDNETNRTLANYIYASSGNTQSAIGGVNMANSFTNELGHAMSDIVVRTKH